MAKIEKSINHKMSLEKAKDVIAGVVGKVQESYPSIIKELTWNDDKTAANVSGKGFKGDFKVDDTKLDINIDLGLLTSPFKGKIEQEIDTKVGEFLGKEGE